MPKSRFAHFESLLGHRFAPVERTSLCVAEFLAELDAAGEKYAERCGFNSLKLNFYLDTGGQKYFRVIRDDGRGGRSVFGFIEKSTGEIIRADGWKSISARSYGRQGNVNEKSSRLSRVTNSASLAYL